MHQRLDCGHYESDCRFGIRHLDVWVLRKQCDATTVTAARTAGASQRLMPVVVWCTVAQPLAAGQDQLPEILMVLPYPLEVRFRNVAFIDPACP
jgi:hypothetical protein